MRKIDAGRDPVSSHTPSAARGNDRRRAEGDGGLTQQKPRPTGLPVLAGGPTPARGNHPVPPGRTAPFLAHVIGQARPGLSPARQARRHPEPAHDAYRAALSLKIPAGELPLRLRDLDVA